MKLLNKDINVLKLEFGDEEYQLISRVMDVPLSAFGMKKLLEKTKLELKKIKSIKQKIECCIEIKSSILELSHVEFSNLKIIFRTSCAIADPQEIHALTGYSWDDAMKLQTSLDSIS